MAIARAISSVTPHPFIRSPDRLDRVMLSRVEIDATAQKTSDGKTYNRSNRPLKLHTDSSCDSNPHELIAFQMVRPDFQGGKTVVAPLEDVLSELSEPETVALHKTRIPFGSKSYSILWRNRGNHHVRFHDGDIMNALRSGAQVSDTVKDALRPLLEVLKKIDQFQVFELGAGETLFLHNTRALHGRTGFAPDSKRLMLGVRMYAGSLA